MLCPYPPLPHLVLQLFETSCRMLTGRALCGPGTTDMGTEVPSDKLHLSSQTPGRLSNIFSSSKKHTADKGMKL